MGTKKYSCPKCGYLTSHLRRHIEVNHKDVSPHVVEQLLDACGMRRRPRKISAPAPPALHATVGDTHAAPVTAPEVSYIHHTGYQLFNEAGGPIPMHIHNSYSSLPGSRKPCLSQPCTPRSETPMRRPSQLQRLVIYTILDISSSTRRGDPYPCIYTTHTHLSLVPGSLACPCRARYGRRHPCGDLHRRITRAAFGGRLGLLGSL